MHSPSQIPYRLVNRLFFGEGRAHDGLKDGAAEGEEEHECGRSRHSKERVFYCARRTVQCTMAITIEICKYTWYVNVSVAYMREQNDGVKGLRDNN